MTPGGAGFATGRTGVSLTVNGRARDVEVEPRSHLGDLLRETLNLTGTHLGCEHGVCGACTVLVDGEPARACLLFAGSCAGATVTTVEGLDDDDIAAALRAAFNREHALQCGYCTPGMIVTARDLVMRLPEADERQVRVGLAGNLCRCTGYAGIVRAVLTVIAERRGGGIGPTVDLARALGPVGARSGEPAPQRRDARRETKPVAVPPVAAAAALASPFEPAHRFAQRIALGHAPEAVFALLGDIEAVAACLPGAFLTASAHPEVVEGGLQVRLGPIAATFRGRARIERDDATSGGGIRGVGSDAGGRSAAEGEIRYRVGSGEAPGSASVDLEVGYTLTGPLAQFGRPGLVRELAGRIAADFARNVDARLSGHVTPVATQDLHPMRLLFGLIRARLAAWLGRG